jgi:hypothetical protein
MLRKIISGGQTGADRAGLDFALEVGLEHGGYVPKGRKAEDGRINDRYRMTELSNPSYSVRTRRNVLESDGTVIFSLNSDLLGGSELTARCAQKTSRPLLHLHAAGKISLDEKAQHLRDFIDSRRLATLNVAGSRESQEPGVYQFTLDLLRRFWQQKDLIS